MKVRPDPDKALGWAYRPDSDTVAAVNRGKSKLKDYALGADKPHYGGNLADALAEEQRQLAPKRKKRRRRMARKVSLKEIEARKKGASKKRTVEAKPSKKVEASGGKKIPLKTLCNELDLDPKATRVKLRRLIEKGEINFHDPSSRWEFTPAQAKEIRQHLNG